MGSQGNILSTIVFYDVITISLTFSIMHFNGI